MKWSLPDFEFDDLLAMKSGCSVAASPAKSTSTTTRASDSMEPDQDSLKKIEEDIFHENASVEENIPGTGNNALQSTTSTCTAHHGKWAGLKAAFFQVMMNSLSYLVIVLYLKSKDVWRSTLLAVSSSGGWATYAQCLSQQPALRGINVTHGSFFIYPPQERVLLEQIHQKWGHEISQVRSLMIFVACKHQF